MAGLMNEPAYVSETLLEGLPVSGEDIYRMNADQMMSFAALGGPERGDYGVYSLRGRNYFARWFSWLCDNPDLLEAGLPDLNETQDFLNSTRNIMWFLSSSNSESREEQRNSRQGLALESCSLAYYGKDYNVFQHFIVMTYLFKDLDCWQRMEWIGMLDHFLNKSNPFLQLVIINSVGALIGDMVWEELNLLHVGLDTFGIKARSNVRGEELPSGFRRFLEIGVGDLITRRMPDKSLSKDDDLATERIVRGWGLEDVRNGEELAQRYIERYMETVDAEEPHLRMESLNALSKAIMVGAPENRLGRALDLAHFLGDEDDTVSESADRTLQGIESLYLDSEDRVELSYKLFDLLVQSHYDVDSLSDFLSRFDVASTRKFLERMAVLSEEAPTAEEREAAREWFDGVYGYPMSGDEYESLDAFGYALWMLDLHRGRDLFRRLPAIEDEGPLTMKRVLVNAYHEKMMDSESGWTRDSHYFNYIERANVSAENVSELDEDGLLDLMQRLIKLEDEAIEASYNARKKS